MIKNDLSIQKKITITKKVIRDFLKSLQKKELLNKIKKIERCLVFVEKKILKPSE